MAKYQFVLAELERGSAAGKQIGEVENADERTCNLRLGGMSQAGFTVPISNDAAGEIADREGDVLLKVYRDGNLELTADCTSAEEVGPGYRRVIKRDQLLNMAYSLPSGDATDVRIASDAASIAKRGMFEEVVSSDVVDGGLRQALITEEVRLRRQAQVQVAIEPGQAGATPTLAASFGGPYWRLRRRMCVQTPSGGTFPDPASVSFPSQDRAQILKALLDNANAITPTGITAGSFASLYAAAFGPVSFKTLGETLDEMVDAKTFPFEPTNTGTSLAYDDFGTSTGNLAGPPGRNAPRGGTWQAAGSSGDFTGYGGGPAIVRSTTNDTAPAGSGPEALGRFDWLSSGPYTDQFAQVDIGYAGSFGQHSGVLVRFNNTSTTGGQWFRASLSLGVTGFLVVEKCVNGTVTQMAHTVDVALTAGQAYSLRLQVDASGNWAAWFWQTGTPSPPAPYLRGQDSDLATGGPLASGKVGIWDLNATATTSDRIYDTFLAQALTQSMDPQGLEYELVPAEPTTGAIATLNVATQIGTTRPHAVFNYGDGARPDELPAYGDEWKVGDFVIARARHNGVTLFDGVVRAEGADISIDKLGKATVTPQLLADSG